MTNPTTSVLLTILLTCISVDASQQTRTPLRDVINRRRPLQACTAGSRPLVLSGSSGTFTSPEFPGHYPNNLLCQWLIVLPDPNDVVQLNFDALSTEARNDTIIIYDGSAVNPQKIVTGFDGDHWNPLPIAINTNEPYVLFEFKTNSAVTSTGFKVSYTSADKSVTAYDPCSVHRPWRISEYSGVFESKGFPNYYYNYANCQWLIESREPGGVVRLDFTYFFTEFFFDKVTIHDGENTSAPVIRSLHGSESPAPTGILSTQKYMLVHFQSDQRDVAPGFQARFTSLPA